MKTLSFNEIYTIKIGQNQNENQNLLESMNENDSWFHLTDCASPHLIINIDFNLLSKQDIYRIAVILKQHTKYKKENNILIDYTLRKDLGLTKTPGMVNLIGKYYTIRV
jgi:predicted ribosome quality control (RQC) complex YloA/Tae2 family protein